MYSCNNCNIQKEKNDFYTNYKTCKECIKERQRERNRKKRNENLDIMKKCNKCNLDKKKIFFRKNRGECKECEKQYGREYNKKNYYIRKKWVENNKDKMKELQKNWSKNNREHINKKTNERYKNDILYKLQKNQRRILNTNINKIKNTEEYVGKLSNIKKWIEYNFDQNMNWENYGIYWHIDHVLPISNFNLENSKDIEVCFNWKNLSPLNAKKNMIKNNKINKKQVRNHLIKLEEYNKKIKEKNFDNYIKNYNEYFATHLVAGNSLES